MADLHNRLEITAPVEIGALQVWNRPFAVPWGNFTEALRARIVDPAVERIADRYPTGGIDLVRDTLWSPDLRRSLLRLFD